MTLLPEARIRRMQLQSRHWVIEGDGKTEEVRSVVLLHTVVLHCRVVVTTFISYNTGVTTPAVSVAILH